MGALAAMGFVLGARVMGDASRPPWLRALLGAATVPLGLGVVLTFSRGTLAALAVGLAVLCLAAPTRAQLRAAAAALGATIVAGGVGMALDGVRALGGSHAGDGGRGDARAAAGADGRARRARPARAAARGGWRGPGRRRWPGRERWRSWRWRSRCRERRPRPGTPAAGADPARLASAESNRYAYWQVALEAFADHPLAGVGSGGFRVEWRRERDVLDPARDAHSLYLETAAELGLVGLLLLGLAIAGVVVGARRGRRGRGPARRARRCTRSTRASTGTGRCRR